MQVYPLKMSPYFRHGEATPWGGDSLRALFQKNSPDARTGESLEVSALPGMASTVANGAFAGKTLPEMIGLWGRALTGSDDPEFPLLLKLLDAREMLSVQVHPGDGYAHARHGKLGKTEAWVVLNAPEDAQLVYGVHARDNGQVGGYLNEGSLTGHLRYVPARPGDVFYIPHGMVHALGEGIVIYEIQQSSDVTYRLWDWGRVGADGKPRELHREDALSVIRPDLLLTPQHGVEISLPGGQATVYIADSIFELWRLKVSGEMPLQAEGRFSMVTALHPLAHAWREGEISLSPGESALLPASLCGVSLKGEGEALFSLPSGRQALRARLQENAHKVAGLCQDV